MNWTCPFCDRAQTVTNVQFNTWKKAFDTQPSKDGHLGIEATCIVCANNDCNKASINVRVRQFEKYAHQHYSFIDTPEITSSRLLPRSYAKPLPDFIPRALSEDYLEACLIRDLSPKASATLARRCLQGMIRDFCGIIKKRLVDEIKELEKQVKDGTADRSISLESVTAIDAVRQVGNIGAHMEADVDYIIDVDPEEAQILIDLLETLFDDWYGEREKRRVRFSNTGNLAASKASLVAKGKAVPRISGPPSQ